MPVRNDNSISLHRTDGILGRERKRISIHGSRKRSIARLAQQLAGDDLLPHRTRDGVSQRRANVVRGKVDTGDNSDVLVLRRGLDTRLRRVREHTARNTETDLGAHDTGVVRWAGAAAVVDQQAERDEEQTRAEDDERLEAAHAVDDHAQQNARNDGAEAVEHGDAGCGFDALVEGDDEHRVQEVALHVPREVERARDAQRAPDGAVYKEVEGQHGVWRPALPHDKGGDAEDADDEGGDHFGGCPL